MLQFPIPKLKKKNNKSKLNGGLASPLIFHFQLETKEYLFYSFYPLSYTIAEQYDVALLMVGANVHCSHIQSTYCPNIFTRCYNDESTKQMFHSVSMIVFKALNKTAINWTKRILNPIYFRNVCRYNTEYEVGYCRYPLIKVPTKLLEQWPVIH